MRSWLQTEYQASIFEDDSGVIAYALYREEKDRIYLRQFFVAHDKRRGGIGRECVKIVFSQVWPKDKRITVDVLCQNEGAIAFWRAVGFIDYCLTLEIYPGNDCASGIFVLNEPASLFLAMIMLGRWRGSP